MASVKPCCYSVPNVAGHVGRRWLFLLTTSAWKGAISSVEQDHRAVFKQLMQHYDDVVAQHVRVKLKIKARLRMHGVIVRGKAVYSPCGRTTTFQTRLRTDFTKSSFCRHTRVARKPYRSDVSDAQWKYLQQSLPGGARTGHPRANDREIPQ